MTYLVIDDISGDLLVVQSGSVDLFVVSASGETTISGSLTVTDSIYSSRLIGTGSLYLQPDKNDSRFLEIYNTSPQDTHITASGGWLYLGNDETYVKVDTYGLDKTIEFKADNGISSSGSLSVTGSTSLYHSGSTILSVNGPQGEVFSVTDDFTSDIFIVQSGSTELFVVSASGDTTISGSLTVTNGITSSLYGTASWAENALTASYISASNIDGTVISASYALSASYAESASYALSSSYAESSSYALSSSYAESSSYALSSSYAESSSYALSSSYASTASFSLATTENRVLVINKSGTTITKGMVVHLTGSNNSSDTPYVITASYENDALSANTLGIASQNIAFNDTGYITTEGVLTGIDVTGFISGQIIYLGSTGSIIGSAPLAPLHAVRLGQVVRDSPSNNGAIYVRVDNGYELGELHDIRDNTTTGSYGDLLVKSGSVWINSKQLTGSYGITGSLTISGSNTFTNIGTTVLSGSVDISGSQTFTGTSAFYGNHTLSGSNTITGNTIMSGSIVVSGSSDFKNSVFTVTGSSFFKGTHQVSGSTTITGSLNVTGDVNVISGSSFTRWGNKLFNYGQFAHTSSIPVTANTSASFAFPVNNFSEGVSVVSGSRLTFENTGLYDIQFTAIANQGTGTPNLHVWFRKTGSNIDNSDTVIQLPNNSQTVLAWNFSHPFTANEYVEIWYHSSTSNTSFPATAAGSGFPSSPSVRVTVTQIA